MAISLYPSYISGGDGLSGVGWACSSIYIISVISSCEQRRRWESPPNRKRPRPRGRHRERGLRGLLGLPARALPGIACTRPRLGAPPQEHHPGRRLHPALPGSPRDHGVQPLTVCLPVASADTKHDLFVPGWNLVPVPFTITR